MATNHRDTLRNVRSIKQLVAYLRDELEWPIEHDDMDDISDLVFDVNPTQLGLKPDVVAKIEYVKRFRPLDHNQPWAIYFVKFAPNNLPVAALRRILNSLSVRQRSGITNQTSNIWRPDDLLFISQYGEDSDRRITFAHFLNTPGKKDLPTLKVLGWDGDDTNLTLDSVAETLKTKLCWPTDTTDVDHWKKKWRSAFQLGHREQITSAKLMADKLAFVARNVRSRIDGALAVEIDNAPLHMLMKSFKESLISDLTEASFADMFAQTISYGLLSARIANGSAKTADELASAMPITSPFLKELMGKFLDISGRKAGAENGLDYDELGISEVVDLLDQANMEAVLRDFGNRNKDEDPVMHFFEGFLKAYDIKIKRDRGVFYTPQPVVSYIVRSVHELLQTEFGLEDGLADTATWGDMRKQHPELRLPPLTDVPGEKRTISPDEPFVQILDPATGTATFLVEVIDLIFRTLTAKWTQARMSPNDQISAWNHYVPKHLLPRLHAYELMMAPYAIAHMKIGLKLAETGYRFGTEERARIYLTNALEPWVKQLPLIGFDALAHEAAAVNEIKRHKRFTVVIGNPPYAGISSNMSDYAQRIVDAYRIADGAALNEKKVWLQDDYVKFIRKAQTTIESAGAGVFGYITNHGYFDNPTFRGMRQSLMGTFQRLRLLDLHGNANKKEQSPDGSEDKNVFDIRQGVAVCLANRGGGAGSIGHAELWGTRESKYAWLVKHDVGDTKFSTLTPDSPFYLFEPQNTDSRAEYNAGVPVTEAFPFNVSGIVTARDGFVIGFEDGEIRQRIQKFLDPRFSDAEIKEEFDLNENYAWRVSSARKELRAEKGWEKLFKGILYRPFDSRRIIYHKSVVFRTREESMRHMFTERNLALSTTRSIEIGRFEHVFCTREIMGHHTVSLKEVNYMFPLWLLPDKDDLLSPSQRHPNLSPSFLRSLAENLGLKLTGAHGLPAGLTPEDIFHYAYAVFHSPGYRSRYAEFLKIDFPRLPLTSSIELFRSLSELGSQLVALHLVESEAQNTPVTNYIGNSTEVVKPGWTDDNGGTVWLDTGGTKAKTTAGTRGFVGVPEAVWNFHIGGYQVCEKWLKDRKGRTLSEEDMSHYHKIIVALSETIRIMPKIDEVIQQHGGWPGAFQTAGNTLSTAVEYKYDERTPKAAEGTLFED